VTTETTGCAKFQSTNQLPEFCRPDALRVVKSTASEHWREKVQHLTVLSNLFRIHIIVIIACIIITIMIYMSHGVPFVNTVDVSGCRL